MSIQGTIYNIQQFSIHDGPGIRTTVFMKGCPLTCWWCHNPESRSPDIVMNGNGTIGKRYSPEELMAILRKDVVFYDQSGGGVTFSGGEPMEQVDFLHETLQLCRREGIHTVVDTCGSASRKAFIKIAGVADLFLFDIKLMDAGLLGKYTSARVGTILDNLEYLMDSGARVMIRIPLIPGITSTPDNLGKIAAYLEKFDPLPEVQLLPYHRTAEGKYEKLNMVNKMKGAPDISGEEISRSYELFKSYGYPVKLG